MQKSVGFGYSKNNKSKKSGGNGILFFVIILIVLICIGWAKFSPESLSFEGEKVVILKGDTIAKFYSKMSKNQTFRMKRYLKCNPESLPNIQEGTYILSGTYSNEEFLSHIAKGPEKEYLSYTVLEGWSIYDIDADLSSKGYISAGDYINYVKNSSKIAELSQKYDFFDSSLSSLEGFLYPDTYFLSNRENLVKELVSMQLNNFKSKIRDNYSSNFSSIQTNYGLDVYKTITLASIIEKEEKNNTNKPTIAGIFYNRLKGGWLIGADITLCYGLAQPYSSCTPSVINKNINDKSNRYNTRQNAGLTPTPIGNPSESTIKATLFPNVTNYYFYLHGSDGTIHYAENSTQHEANKKYL